MLPLVSALLAPLAGVLIYVTMHHRPRTVRLLDKAVIVVLPLLVAVQVVPHAWEERNLVPVVMVALGAGLLVLVERLSHTLARYTDDATILFAVLAISVHALVEGRAAEASARAAWASLRAVPASLWAAVAPLCAAAAAPAAASTAAIVSLSSSSAHEAATRARTETNATDVHRAPRRIERFNIVRLPPCVVTE